MYELIQLTEHDYYIEAPAKIGLVRISDEDVVLIDSGNNKDAAKKVHRLLESKGWNLQSIYITHSHADHIGGNRFLQDKYNCNIYAKGVECAFSQNTWLEPMGLYGGLPFKELKNKFLMAQESRVLPINDGVMPDGMKLIDLPGHCFEMVGFVTSEGTAYIGDSLSSEEVLAKYSVAYLWDPNSAIRTLEFLKTLKVNRFVPSHASITEDIAPLADVNISAIEDVKSSILNICDTPVSFESILKEIFACHNLEMTAQQYALIGSTVRSYLTNLYEEGLVAYKFVDNEMKWEKKLNS